MNEKKNFERLVIFAIAATMCLSALAVLPTVCAAGTDYYVSPTGSDSNDGLTPAQAWATINKGTCSSSPLTSGDILHVADGTYTITGRIWVEKAGIIVSGNTASPGNVVVQYSPVANSLIFDMRANDVTVEGIKTISGKSGFYFDQSATGCTISHCIIENAYESGVYIYNGNGHTIEYTTITNPGQMGNLGYSNGVSTRADTTTIDNCTIISDKVQHMKWGVYLDVGANHVVSNNTISGSWEAAIRADSSVKPVTISGNDIDDATEGYQYGPAILLAGHNDGSTVSNNHIDDVVASSAIGVWDAWDITISGNRIGVDDISNDVRLEGIRVSGCGGSGANRVEVTGNTIHNTGYAAVLLINSDNAYVYSNIIGDCNNYGADGSGDWDYASIHVDENTDNAIVGSNDIRDGINGIQVWGDNCQVTNNEIYDMGLTYADTKGTAGVGNGVYYNSGIIIGSNWLTSNFKPTGTTVTCNSIHDNYWGLYVRDYATLSPGDPSVLSVTAEFNWWGDASGPGGVGPGTGDAVSANVDYCPWLSIVEYGDVSLSGGFQSGHFDNIWDLTKGDIIISFTYDANGLVDDFGGEAHAWAELGIREVGYGDFNPTWDVEGAGVWLATDYDWNVNTFDPDPPGAPTLDLDDKLILQKAGGHGEGDYNLPSTPPNPWANHAVWFDCDGVDQWQAQMWGAIDGVTYNTGGTYDIVITLQATSDTAGEAYMTINGEPQGFYVPGWHSGPADLMPAGMTFTGDMTQMQVFYGLYGYGATHTVSFSDITVRGYTLPLIESFTLSPNPAIPIEVGTLMNLDATFTDPCSNTHTATIDWDGVTTIGSVDENAGTVSDSHTYLTTGVNTVSLTLTNCANDGDSEEFKYVVVYDPSAGFVTGGGWINSEAGAYAPDPDAEGKAIFGFVSKYKKGQQTPTGNTEFQFKAGDLNFHSDSYDWLVIAGSKAKYKGTGTINGEGSYKFMLSAIDEKLTPSTDVDMFRIKIWWEDAVGNENIVYDNQPTDPDALDQFEASTVLGGGQIVIHKAK